MGRPHVLMVCFIADPFDPLGSGLVGGGHLFLFDLGRHLVRSGLRVTYLTRLNGPGKREKQRLGSLCQIVRVPVGPPRAVPIAEIAADIPTLVNVSGQHIAQMDDAPDVVHSHYWISGVVVRNLVELGTLRAARHLHSILSLGRLKQELGEPPTPADELRDASEKRVFREADELIAVCQSEKRDVERLYSDVLRKAIRIIPYGVDVEHFQPRPESTDSALRRAYRRFEEGGTDLPGGGE